MKTLKTALVTLAGASLAVAQPASAATARAASPVADSEQMAGGIPGAALPAILAILAVAVFAIIQSQSDDDDSDIPASP